MSGFGEMAANALKEEGADKGMGVITPTPEQSSQGTLVLPIDPEAEAAKAAAQAAQQNDGDEGSQDPSATNAPVVDTPVKDTFTIAELKEVFGIDTDSIDAIKETYTTARQKAQQFDEVLPKYKQYEEVLPKVKDPFVDPVFKQMNDFAKTTGIKDVNVISKFIGKTTEELEQSPVQLLALQKMVNTPSLSGRVSLSKLEEAIAEEYGVSVDVTKADIPVRMELAVAEAATNLQGKLTTSADSDDIFTQAAKQHEAQQQAYQQKLNTVVSYVSNIAEGFKEVSQTIGEHKVTAQVSDDVRKAIANEFTSYLASNDVDLSNPTVASQVKEAFASRARQLMVDSLLEATVKTVQGVSTQKVLKEVHNGQDVNRDGVAAAAKPTQDAWSDALKARWEGKKP